MKRILSVIVAFAICITVFGADFVSNGIYYKFIGNNEVSVTGPSSSSEYSGHVVIPDTVTNDSVTYNVTKIGKYAFSNCDDMTGVTLPNSITFIDESAFLGCDGLTSIKIPDGVTSIENYTFTNCVNLKHVKIPDGVTTIGMSAFSGCSSLAMLDLPSNLTSIGDYAFVNSGLVAIDVPEDVTRIGVRAFMYSDLTEVVLNDGLSVIDTAAFFGCSKLVSITIPQSVTKIDINAFFGCSSLDEIICLATTPPTIMNSNSFYDYTATLYVPAGSIAAYDTAQYWQDFSTIQTAPISLITTMSNDSAKGMTFGDGIYTNGKSVRLIALPNKWHYFQQWNDGNTDNPRTITVAKDSVFTAMFEDYDTANGITLLGGTRHDTIYLRDTIYMTDTVYIVQTDTIYLEYDGSDAMQYSLEEQGIYYSNGVVYNPQETFIKLYSADGRLVTSGRKEIDMSLYVDGIYIVTDGKGGFIKFVHAHF